MRGLKDILILMGQIISSPKLAFGKIIQQRLFKESFIVFITMYLFDISIQMLNPQYYPKLDYILKLFPSWFGYIMPFAFLAVSFLWILFFIWLISFIARRHETRSYFLNLLSCILMISAIGIVKIPSLFIAHSIGNKTLTFSVNLLINVWVAILVIIALKQVLKISLIRSLLSYISAILLVVTGWFSINFGIVGIFIYLRIGNKVMDKPISLFAITSFIIFVFLVSLVIFDKKIRRFRQKIISSIVSGIVAIMLITMLLIDNVALHLYLSNLYYEKNMLDKSIVELEKIVSLRPEIIRYRNWLASRYRQNNQYKESISEYKQIIEIKPDDSSSFNEIGTIYFKYLNDFEKGKENFEKAIELNKNNALAYCNLALLYERSGNLKKAQELYNKVLDIPYKDSWTKIFAVNHLKIIDLIKKKQLIKDWLVIGPFDNSEQKGFNTTYPPEKEIDLDATYQAMGKEAKWFRPYKPSDYGYVDFNRLMTPNDNTVAYALCYIYSDKPRVVLFKTGSDDTITMWLNDEKVLEKKVYRAPKCDEDETKVSLKKGENKVLIKVCESYGEWGFFFRVTDLKGNFIEGLEFSPTLGVTH